MLTLGALYILSNPGILNNSRTGARLFLVDFKYNRYSHIVTTRVISENREEFKRIGVKVGNMGTQSARKGAATRMIASGCTISPNMMLSNCNRVQWKMGAQGIIILIMRVQAINF